VLKVLSDDKGDIEPTYEQEGDQCPSNICTKVVPDDLLCYFEFLDKLVADFEKNECLNMQTRKDIKTTSMKAQGLMEGFMNNLVAGKDKLSLLILELEAFIEATNES